MGVHIQASLTQVPVSLTRNAYTLTSLLHSSTAITGAEADLLTATATATKRTVRCKPARVAAPRNQAKSGRPRRQGSDTTTVRSGTRETDVRFEHRSSGCLGARGIIKCSRLPRARNTELYVASSRRLYSSHGARWLGKSVRSSIGRDLTSLTVGSNSIVQRGETAHAASRQQRSGWYGVGDYWTELRWQRRLSARPRERASFPDPRLHAQE